ncbi:MAG: polysulfide reductase NrfD [Eggerthellaceae bacterium]|nr:polysulfide reductase NrfD [Eggerthellaceae bacterium]
MLQEMWGWQPALYLFLGGMGAGAFIAAAALYLMDKKQLTRSICISMWAALASLAVGLLLLLSELVFPVRGLMMWQSFSHFSSWMTLGAWGAFLAMVVFFVSALLAMPKVSSKLAEKWELYQKKGHKVRRVLAIVGIVLGAFVAFYTGMLLSSVPGVPLWNTLLLPCLFTVSALDTGVALVEIITIIVTRASDEELPERTRVVIERSVIVLVVVELMVMAIFLSVMMAGDVSTASGSTAVLSAEQLLSGLLAPYFWVMVIAIGLLLPLVVAIAGLALKRKGMEVAMALGALGALIGGCELRFLILSDGIHAEYVLDALQKLIS